VYHTHNLLDGEDKKDGMSSLPFRSLECNEEQMWKWWIIMEYDMDGIYDVL
jgi:hypothetical protein